MKELLQEFNNTIFFCLGSLATILVIALVYVVSKCIAKKMIKALLLLGLFSTGCNYQINTVTQKANGAVIGKEVCGYIKDSRYIECVYIWHVEGHEYISKDSRNTGLIHSESCPHKDHVRMRVARKEGANSDN